MEFFRKIFGAKAGEPPSTETPTKPTTSIPDRFSSASSGTKSPVSLPRSPIETLREGIDAGAFKTIPGHEHLIIAKTADGETDFLQKFEDYGTKKGLKVPLHADSAEASQ